MIDTLSNRYLDIPRALFVYTSNCFHGIIYVKKTMNAFSEDS